MPFCLFVARDLGPHKGVGGTNRQPTASQQVLFSLDHVQWIFNFLPRLIWRLTIEEVLAFAFPGGILLGTIPKLSIYKAGTIPLVSCCLVWELPLLL